MQIWARKPCILWSDLKSARIFPFVLLKYLSKYDAGISDANLRGLHSLYLLLLLVFMEIFQQTIPVMHPAVVPIVILFFIFQVKWVGLAICVEKISRIEGFLAVTWSAFIKSYILASVPNVERNSRICHRFRGTS